jgi:hypothetical protein
MTVPVAAETGIEARRRLREVVLEAGGVVGDGRPAAMAGAPLQTPFGTAEPVEGDEVSTVPVGEPAADSRDAAFADGTQRYIVEGRIGLTPVLRAHVGAAVLTRRDRDLLPVVYEAEEFVVAPLDRLADTTVTKLHETGLQVRDCGVPDRAHPILDVQLAVQQVERRRRRAEIRAVTEFRRREPDMWLVVDGSLRGYADAIRESRVLGAIKSHETQFLAGMDLETALTLPEAHRTTVFRRVGAREDTIHSWYLRLWDWAEQDILFGLLRIERERGPDVLDEIDEVCRWLLAERSPVSTPDARWDRLLYPIHEVENFLKAKAGSWW